MNGIIHFLTHLLTQMGRLVSKLTVQHSTKKISVGEAPHFIALRPYGDRRDIPGSLALSVILAPAMRSRRRQKPWS